MNIFRSIVFASIEEVFDKNGKNYYLYDCEKPECKIKGGRFSRGECSNCGVVYQCRYCYRIRLRRGEKDPSGKWKIEPFYLTANAPRTLLVYDRFKSETCPICEKEVKKERWDAIKNNIVKD